NESHKNSNVTSKSAKSGPTAFATWPGNNNWNPNRNNNNNGGGLNSNNNNRRFARVSNLVCKHYNMTGHTIDRCFELVGYPPGFKRNNSNQNISHHVSNSDVKSDHIKSAPHTLTSDQYQRLMTLLSDTGNVSTSHASVAGFNSKVHDGDWSNDPNDDGGDSSVNGNKSAPNSSADSPSDHTVDEVAKDQVHKQTDNSDIVDLSRSSSSRKDTKDPQYETKTEVSKGI
ncbi:hypothetical protein Tco_1357846, partial [Tanacetum coccineum]